VNIHSGSDRILHPFPPGISIHIASESLFTSLRNDHSLAPESASEVWLRETAIASTQDLDGDLVPQLEELEQAGITFPPERGNVLRLLAPARRCFVLPTLAGFRPEFCADLLRLDRDRIDEASCDAASTVAGFSDGEVVTCAVKSTACMAGIKRIWRPRGVASRPFILFRR
jgi:hypothetical protein